MTRSKPQSLTIALRGTSTTDNLLRDYRKTERNVKRALQFTAHVAFCNGDGRGGPLMKSLVGQSGNQGHKDGGRDGYPCE